VTIDDSDIERWMFQALLVAQVGRFRVDPNPCVGAIVLDRDGREAGRGAHTRWGGAHAEVRALAKAGARARGGTLVVTLEPCAHEEKKTPPCAPAVVAAGIARVLVGCGDPNSATSGRAAAAFARAGVAYEVGILHDRCRAAIVRYERHLRIDRPWVVAKWAASLDGRAADAAGASRWISGDPSRRLVHELRAVADAVVVGSGTVAADDPSLTSHALSPRRALRVVLDSTLRTSTTSKVVATARDTPTLLVAVRGADASRRIALESAGAQVVEVAAGVDGRVDVAEALRELHRRGVRRALLEAGGTLQAACLRAGVVDQVAAFVAPVVLGGGGPTPFSGEGWPIASAPRLEEVRVTQIGPDALIEGYWPARTVPSA